MAIETCFINNAECRGPNVIVADIKIEIPALKYKQSIPLCLGHAAVPYIAERLLKDALGPNQIFKMKVIVRQPFRKILKLLNLDK